jgi:hypothetical protein
MQSSLLVRHPDTISFSRKYVNKKATSMSLFALSPTSLDQIFDLPNPAQGRGVREEIIPRVNGHSLIEKLS